MNYISVCSGIEAATVAWHPLGWKPVAFAEIEKFPSAVLAHHYPNVPNHGDFTTIEENSYEPIDLLVGGTPCQDFSVAGLRAGMDGARGQLTVEFARLAGRLRPRWLVWENVPGVLSIDKGRAFGTFLAMLGQFGYGTAYRVLDAQHFGVPQCRRRVFVVGHLGDWRRAAAVLFERHSLSGNPPPRRQAGKTAPTIPARSLGGGGLGTDFDCDGGLVESASWPAEAAPTLNAHFGEKLGLEDQHIRGGQVCSSDTHRIAPAVTSKWAKGSGGPSGDECQNLIATEAASMMSRPGRRIFPDPDEPIVVGVYTCNECGKEYPALGNVNPTSPRVQVDGFMLLNNPCPFCGGQASTVSYPPGSYGSTAEGCGADDYPDTTHTLRGEGFDASEDGTGRGTPIVPVGIDGGEVGHALRANASHSGDKGDGGMNTTVVLTLGHTTSKANYSNPKPGEPCHPFAIGLDEEQNAVEDGFGCLKARKEAGGFEGSVMTPTMAVRRLTPRECERLQGFPDDHTRISEKTADGTRYKALGNSMAVPVMRWIGERIQQVEAQTA